MSEEVAEPEQARPWRAEDGPQPRVQTWSNSERPALRVWSCGAWRWAGVIARQDWPDGRVAYQVEIDAAGTTSVRTRAYWWPQPGLRVAHIPTARSLSDSTV